MAAAAFLAQTKEAARRNQTARKRRLRAADAAAAAADNAAAVAALHEQKQVVCREADAARKRRPCSPLPRPQTTWRRSLVSIRTRWRVARLMLRAGVGRVQLMPRPHAQMCVEWSECAAAEPADDAAAALHEQKKVASREADAARRRPSRAADATATLRCVWNGLCAARCGMCVGQAAAYVLCLVAPEMSGGPSLRCQYGIDI